MNYRGYEVDTRLLGYWVAGVLGLGLAVFIGYGLFFDEPETVEPEGLELDLNEDLLAGEFADLYVYQDGEPVEGATVIIDNEMNGQTDSTGYQVLSVPNDSFELEVRYEGLTEAKTLQPIKED